MLKKLKIISASIAASFFAVTDIAHADDVVFSTDQTNNSAGNYVYQASTHSAVRTVTVNTGITLTNAGMPAWGASAFYIDATVSSLVNRGTVTGDYYTIYLDSSGVVTSFENYGSIVNTSTGPAIRNYEGTITTLTNLGTISSAGSYAIDNSGFMSSGVIGTLNNLQGASSSALTWRGGLPSNYNIIINSTANYGQLSVTNPSGSTTFGISSLSGSNIGVAGTRYQNVLSGVAASAITNENTTLTYTNGALSATYNLVADDSSVANTWDLLILSMLNGPSATDTQASLNALTAKLRGAFSGQAIATNFANMNTYDCNLFDKRGLCIAVGGQQTYVDNPSSSNMTSAVVVTGYKVSPTLRIGGFLNQNLNNHTSASVVISNDNPLMGLFAVWNQNEDHLGYQVKIANAYQDKDVTTLREVTGTSEAGRGNTELNTRSYVGEVSYAFLAKEDKTLVRPYAAVRYTRIKQDAYTEETTSAVTAPLTYAALSDRSTAALLGIKVDHKLAEKLNLKASLGVEQDLSHQVDNLTATGVSGLTSENFNDNIERTRPVASIGAYYMPAKNQRIAADLYYQQLPFQSTGSTTAYINYMIGL